METKSYFPYSVTEEFSPELEKRILEILSEKYPEYYKLLTVLNWHMWIHYRKDRHVLSISPFGNCAHENSAIEFILKGVGEIWSTIPNYDWYEGSWEPKELDRVYYFVKGNIAIY